MFSEIERLPVLKVNLESRSLVVLGKVAPESVNITFSLAELGLFSLAMIPITPRMLGFKIFHHRSITAIHILLLFWYHATFFEPPIRFRASRPAQPRQQVEPGAFWCCPLAAVIIKSVAAFSRTATFIEMYTATATIFLRCSFGHISIQGSVQAPHRRTYARSW